MTVSKNQKANLSKTTKTASAPENRTVSGLPDAETLKGKFKEGSVPLQGDFASLIDIANFGRLAVGNDKPGWGLVLDSNGKLNWDINRIFNVKWSLSPTGNEENRVFDPYLPDVAGKHGNIVLLALQEEVGPIEAVNSFEDTFTVYNLKTVKITSDGKRSNINLKVRAYKYIGLNSSTYYPMEYLPDEDLKFSLYCHFYLDTTTENLKDCMLEIEPLTLAVHYIPDFNSDPVGEMVSLITMHFAYNDPSLMFPKAGEGIITDGKEVSVNLGQGMIINEDGAVELVVIGENINEIEHYATVVRDYNDNFLYVPLGDGLISDENSSGSRSIKVKLSGKGGLDTSYGSGELYIKIKENGGISINDSGELHLSWPNSNPSGMVTAFLGPEVPEGWALCDGKNKTPDLRSMFIPLNKGSAEKRDADQNDAQLVYIIKK